MSLLAPGSVLADFRVEDVVGRGGMGVVYQAVQLSLDRPVALKLIAPHLTGDEGFRERFVKESRLSASLDHPHIVPVYAAGEEDGIQYIAMRFVQGANLKTTIASSGCLDPGRAVRLVQQIASALDSAHAHGLVHRDVKPANVLISPEGGGEHAYLTDFGVTKRRTSTETPTGTGEWVGTLDYVAPEQLRGEVVDGRADTYSLGCMLYECVTGSVPFPRARELAKMWAHISDEPPSASALVPHVPEALSEVIRRAMAKAPGERFPSTGDFGRATLDAVTSGSAEQATKAAPSIGARRPKRATAGGRLYERESELRQAEAELDAAAIGSGRMLFIEGQAGIGKSRLLSEVSRMAEDRGFAVYRASGVELEREFAYGVVRQLFEYHAHRLAPGERAVLFRGAAALAEPVLLASGRSEAESGPPDEAPGDRVVRRVARAVLVLRRAVRAVTGPAGGGRRGPRRQRFPAVPGTSCAATRGAQAGPCPDAPGGWVKRRRRPPDRHRAVWRREVVPLAAIRGGLSGTRRRAAGWGRYGIHRRVPSRRSGQPVPAR